MFKPVQTGNFRKFCVPALVHELSPGSVISLELVLGMCYLLTFSNARKNLFFLIFLFLIFFFDDFTPRLFENDVQCVFSSDW